MQIRSLHDTAGATDSIARAVGGSAPGRGQAFDATVRTTRVAEKHLTVLADRTGEEGDVFLIRLIDEDKPNDIAGVYVGPGEDPVVNCAIDIAKLIGGD